MLNLAEELLLLALDDEKGTVRMGAQTGLRYGLAGAVLAELLLSGRLAMGDKTRLSVTDPTPTGDDVLDQALARIGEAKRRASIKNWIMRLGGAGGRKNIQRRLLDRLVERGILRKQEERYLWVIPVRHYPALDSSQEMEVREQLRAAVLGGSAEDERVVVLAGLVKGAGIVKDAFPGEGRKATSKRIDEITKGDVLGAELSKAVAQAVAAAAAAAAAAGAT